MRALLVIDDGLASPKAAGLRQSLIAAGLNVAMIGPESIDLVPADGLAESVEPEGSDSANPEFLMNGSPSACVHVAMGAGLVEDVDVAIVVNLAGAAVVEAQPGHGYVGAACEAAQLGVPALAVSLGAVSQDDLPRCGDVVAELAAWAVATPVPVRCVLDMHVPAMPHHRALKLIGADEELLAGDGHICVRPVNLDQGSPHSGERLTDWAERTVAAINPRLAESYGKCLAGCCG